MNIKKIKKWLSNVLKNTADLSTCYKYKVAAIIEKN
jgi:hypothetical protein